MTANEKLRGEVAHTETVLREAALKLLEWADLNAGAFFTPPVPPEEIRQVAHALSKQGGRLSMARELTLKRK